ncbi:GNAT family N-acetyltransferase [Roseibium sp. MMSF_3412]|uniref:GNAT family N-acetyltransferase n=1 Tax=Roseibium sp. MMSF_3412 TaxID=3046712 RepID=UPI00273F551E|nr:GNAT family protein [Roseibium sp. MMSF_3412]
MNEQRFPIGMRLYLRPVTEDDIHRGWLEWINAEQDRPHLDAPLNQTEDDLRSYIESNRRAGDHLMAVCTRSDDRYIGNVRLSSIRERDSQATYGRLLGDVSVRGQGYGTEMLAMLFEYGFRGLRLNRLWTGVLAPNTASLASNRRLGVKMEGTARQARRLPEGYVDVVQFALLSEEYEDLRSAMSGVYLDPEYDIRDEMDMRSRSGTS